MTMKSPLNFQKTNSSSLSKTSNLSNSSSSSNSQSSSNSSNSDSSDSDSSNFSSSSNSFSAFGILAQTNFTQLSRKALSFGRHSPFLLFLIGIFVFGYGCFSFILFQKALRFVAAFPGLGNLLIERMIYLLFAFLFVLLLISNLLISYTNLFRNRETSHLLCLPISPQTIFCWKFFESTMLASWAFLFLIFPLLLAFGKQQEAGWGFYGMTILSMILFIILPAVAGSVGAILIARFLDRRLFQMLVIGIIILGIGFTIGIQTKELTDEMLETRVLTVLDRLLSNTRFAIFPFLPSYWLSSSVIQGSEGAFFGATFFLMILLSYVLFFGTLTFTKIGKPFYEAFSAFQSRGSRSKVWGGVWRFLRSSNSKSKPKSMIHKGLLERLIECAFWLKADTRSVLLKDIRVFWRDTTQWGQSLMLFGLLAVYIINLRHFSSQGTNPFWINLISYLNLGACSLNLATLTTRFVYPQFSLEGRRLWIVGMAPFGLDKLVSTKFWLSCLTSLLITVGLMTLSSIMLKMPLVRMAFFSIAVAIMTLTLNGLAMGLGTLYPNFKEDDPSKIVSGFGGTFCLILSFIYIVFSVIILALFSFNLEIMTLISWGVFLGVSILLGWLPRKFGKVKLQNLEI